MSYPLSFSPMATTTSTDETEHLFQRELVDSRILNVKGKKSFSVDMNGVALGNSVLSFLRHSSDYEIDCGEVDCEDTVMLGIGYNQPASSTINGHCFSLNEHAAVIANRSTLRHQRTAESCEVVFKCSAKDVDTRLQASLNRPISSEVVYASSVPQDHGVGAHARASLLYVLGALDATPTLLDHPLIVKNFEELLLGVVLSLPSNFSKELLAPAGMLSAPASVARAEEYIEANAGLPITTADILVQAGCSRKVLFAEFRKFRGYTPGEFLAAVRLRAAHDRLSNPKQMDTVTSIAYESGFSHMGRFSQFYQKRYGVRPSETLRLALLR
jgi:AraC-like DNA-binding protein